MAGQLKACWESDLQPGCGSEEQQAGLAVMGAAWGCED